MSKIGLRISMPINKLVEKAKKLLESRRIEPLDYGVFNVVGDHGTYTVVQDYRGNVSCNCPGFMKYRKCSHATAVIILTASQGKKSHKRKSRRKARAERR